MWNYILNIQLLEKIYFIHFDIYLTYLFFSIFFHGGITTRLRKCGFYPNCVGNHELIRRILHSDGNENIFTIRDYTRKKFILEELGNSSETEDMRKIR